MGLNGIGHSDISYFRVQLGVGGLEEKTIDQVVERLPQGIDRYVLSQIADIAQFMHKFRLSDAAFSDVIIYMASHATEDELAQLSYARLDNPAFSNPDHLPTWFKDMTLSPARALADPEPSTPAASTEKQL